MKALWILLGILKWVGIVLLALLLLLLLLVLFVLISPIRYRLEGERKAALSGSFGVRWLLGALRAEGSYSQAAGLRYRVRVLGRTILGDAPQEKKRKKRVKKRKKAEKNEIPPAPDLVAAAEKGVAPGKEENAKPPAEENAIPPEVDLVAVEKSVASAEENAIPPAPDLVAVEKSVAPGEENAIPPAVEEQDAEKTEKPLAWEESVEGEPLSAQSIPQRMQTKEIRRVCAAEARTEPSAEVPPPADAADASQPKTMRRVKLSELEEIPPAEDFFQEGFSPEEDAFFTGMDAETDASEKSEKIPPILKRLWRVEGKKEIFRALRRLLKRLLKGILPGHFQWKGKLGLGEPAWTGYLLGFIGILQAKYGKDIQIEGDFTKLAAEDMEIKLDGTIRLGGLLWAMLAFLLEKPVRRAIKRLWNARKAGKGTGE